MQGKLLYIHNTDCELRKANLTQVINMCNAFYAVGYDVTLSINNRNQNDLKKNLESIYGPINFNIILRKTTSNNIVFKYLFNYRIKRTIKDINPSVIFIRSHFFIKKSLKAKCITIFESHDFTLHKRFSFLDSYYKKYIVKSTIEKNNFFIISISENLRKKWVEMGISDEKIFTLHDGFNKDYFLPELSKKDARHLLGLNSYKIIVTYTGSLYKDRGIEIVFELAQSFPQATFLIIGGTEEQVSALREQLLNNSVKNIILIGYVEHRMVPKYLYASDVLLAIWTHKVRTINYCSPLKIFEYMASGRYLLAQGFPTIKEVLINDYNSVICKPGDTNDMINKLSDIINKKYSEDICFNAKKDAYNNYTWEIRAKKIHDHLSLLNYKVHPDV